MQCPQASALRLPPLAIRPQARWHRQRSGSAECPRPDGRELVQHSEVDFDAVTLRVPVAHVRVQVLPSRRSESTGVIKRSMQVSEREGPEPRALRLPCERPMSVRLAKRARWSLPRRCWSVAFDSRPPPAIWGGAGRVTGLQLRPGPSTFDSVRSLHGRDRVRPLQPSWNRRAVRGPLSRTRSSPMGQGGGVDRAQPVLHGPHGVLPGPVPVSSPLGPVIGRRSVMLSQRCP